MTENNAKHEDELPEAATGPASNIEEPIAGGGNSAAAQTSPPLDLPEDLPGAYQKLLAEKANVYDLLLRKQAELENFRKRVMREKEEYLQHANTDLIRSFLPVLDGFERALRYRDTEADDAFAKGIEMIHQEFLAVLARSGVTPIEAMGKIFDPHLHQAVETVEAKGHRDQEVVEELQRGYKLKNRLLRPAIVKVASASKK